MITDARVFDPEFVPPDVEHRPAQISHLTDILQRTVEDTGSETALLYGPPGAGKTFLGQFSLEKLQEEYLGVNTQYVNCLGVKPRGTRLVSSVEAELGHAGCSGYLNPSESQQRDSPSGMIHRA